MHYVIGDIHNEDKELQNMLKRHLAGKTRIFAVVFLLCALLSTACGKTDGTAGNKPEDGSGAVIGAGEAAESAKTEPAQGNPGAEQALLEENKLLEEQRESYARSIEKLDRMLSESRELSESYKLYEDRELSGNSELTENRDQEKDGGIYWEELSTVYMFSESYYGVLRAEYGEGGTSAFQIVMRDGEKKEKHRFECRLLSDGSLWFSFQTESKSEKDLPDYIVNEDALRYSRVDYVYDDGRTDIEEEKELRRQEAEQYLAKKTGGEAQEFWYGGDFLYRIDRGEKLFVDGTEEKESCIAAFLREQARRIDCQLPVSEASVDIVERYKPAGYSLLHGKNGWVDIAVSDLNRDGRMDYVAVLYPDDYEEERRYTDWSPYELISEYYASEFWLLLSSEDGGYEQIQLSDSIEYWDTALVLTEVTFVDEGILQLEYFVGRSPFTNALLRFQYDEEYKDFYMLRSYYRDSGDNSLLAGDTENYGRTKMLYYFSDNIPQDYREGRWQLGEDIFMPDGTGIYYFSDSFQYCCENLMMEHRINSLIWEKEYELVQTFAQYCQDKDTKLGIEADPVFYNGRLVSGVVVMDVRPLHDNTVRIWMPVMVDKLSGEYVTVPGLLEKEEFLQIFEDWSNDALSREAITAEEKEQCREAIEKRWEKADTTEGYFEEKEGSISLQIVQEGVEVGVWSKYDLQQESCLIDKEYFRGTEVWDYYGMEDVIEE